jgi:ribosomal protein L34
MEKISAWSAFSTVDQRHTRAHAACDSRPRGLRLRISTTDPREATTAREGVSNGKPHITRVRPRPEKLDTPSAACRKLAAFAPMSEEWGHMKRTFQPNNRRRRRPTGFECACSTKGGRRVLSRASREGTHWRVSRSDDGGTDRTFTRASRLRARKVFSRRLRGAGIGCTPRYFVLYALKGATPRSRLGITATKKFGHAVARIGSSGYS